MTPNEYQKLCARSRPKEYGNMLDLKHLNDQHILHAQLGVASESGELADAVKKWLIYNQDRDELNIFEECGDLMWYISLMLSACNYTLEECMEQNIEKLKIRYPHKFTEQDAKERKDKI